jgi:predicted nucleic acid-binding protein
MPLLWISLILKENSNVAGSAVVNASPLIFLSSAGLVDLLQLISAEVIVPESVATEIEVRGKRDPRAGLGQYFLALWLLKHLRYQLQSKPGD